MHGWALVNSASSAVRNNPQCMAEIQNWKTATQLLVSGLGRLTQLTFSLSPSLTPVLILSSRLFLDLHDFFFNYVFQKKILPAFFV
jgi:hypothetical protein